MTTLRDTIQTEAAKIQAAITDLEQKYLATRANFEADLASVNTHLDKWSGFLDHEVAVIREEFNAVAQRFGL